MMRKLAILPAIGAALLLTACGSADDASTEASADTVEMPADAALAPIDEEPVADPSASVTDAPDADAPETDAQAEASAEKSANAAADAAADVAAEAAAAAEKAAAE